MEVWGGLYTRGRPGIELRVLLSLTSTTMDLKRKIMRDRCTQKLGSGDFNSEKNWRSRLYLLEQDYYTELSV